MPNLESLLQLLNANFINIDGDRKIYTNHFNNLRDKIYKNLQQELPLKNWLNGHKLGGSYGDNLKITKPNEFDLQIFLKFPENDLIIVKKDPQRPGNVLLDMTQLLDTLRKQEHEKESYLTLNKLVTENNLLLENKLQNLISEAMRNTLEKMNMSITVDGKVSKLTYKRCGPAHTISIDDINFKYSVDFVPAIRLKASQNILGPRELKYFQGTEFWEAIPKPLKPPTPHNVSFRASYYDAENAMIKGRQRLKEVIKLIKKFRDAKSNMHNLKSYYIKTLLLWQIEEKPATYWNASTLKDMTIDMFRKLMSSLTKTGGNGKLLFFWDPELDLFAIFQDNQRKDMFNCVSGHLYILERANGNLTEDIEKKVLSIFSTQEERAIRKQQSNGGQQLNQTSNAAGPPTKDVLNLSDEQDVPIAP